MRALTGSESSVVTGVTEEELEVLYGNRTSMLFEGSVPRAGCLAHPFKLLTSDIHGWNK